jgi:GNAT superfamily N-acetyltransferase
MAIKHSMIIPYEPSLLPVVHEIAKQFHLESRYRDMPFEQEKVTRLLKHPNVFCAIAITSNHYVGGILGIVQEHWFSDVRVGVDLGLYVLPEYRGKSAAPIRLVKAFEAFCHSKDCFEIMLASSSTIHEDRALRLYQHLGYVRCGFISHKACFSPTGDN